MRNKYWILRHGRSKANEAGIIVSSMENGVKVRGLPASLLTQPVFLYAHNSGLLMPV